MWLEAAVRSRQQQRMGKVVVTMLGGLLSAWAQLEAVDSADCRAVVDEGSLLVGAALDRVLVAAALSPELVASTSFTVVSSGSSVIVIVASISVVIVTVTRSWSEDPTVASAINTAAFSAS
jgi:hypothetical protein